MALLSLPPEVIESGARGGMAHRPYRMVRTNLSMTCKSLKFLRLQVFKVGRYRLDGQERTLAMHIESDTYEKTQAARGDVNIFKPYWLG
ncbi:MAG: hypothetical protein Q9173_002678 [Seirophora scorigena]